MRRLTEQGRKASIQRIMATATREELHALELRIRDAYAATPAQRALNDAELDWVRAAARARREMVGKVERRLTD